MLNRLPSALGLVLLLCVPMLFVVTVHRATDRRLLVPGDPAPPLTAQDLNSGETRQINFTGRRSVILFFGADCPHCQRELVGFDRLHTTHAFQMDFLAISQSEALKTVNLQHSMKLRAPIMIDGKREGSMAFGVEAVPALFLVDEKGIVVFSRSGELSFAAMEKAISRIFDDNGREKNHGSVH